ncbi:hypothetical protein GPECTOR_17g1001 [Gonium pectorale]|uniref:Uncharacterized protein n=1 Tax=Gonium pectorale TaxID=33097 RepID=A0A150GJX1_GONPE|nr:hypothetical protein GPECTOR_17g1001 [Gonium pectorale]|eukprot:KXZ50128.1 hypothetical protein GPECTOR_17g1001 [Gonium pectorale]
MLVDFRAELPRPVGSSQLRDADEDATLNFVFGNLATEKVLHKLQDNLRYAPTSRSKEAIRLDHELSDIKVERLEKLAMGFNACSLSASEEPKEKAVGLLEVRIMI